MKQSNETQQPARRILRLPAVQELCGLSRTTIHRAVTAGTFPRPVPIGRRAVGWLQHEVDAWLQTQAGRRRGV